MLHALGARKRTHWATKVVLGQNSVEKKPHVLRSETHTYIHGHRIRLATLVLHVTIQLVSHMKSALFTV
mgnify:CR=1 FL=1